MVAPVAPCRSRACPGFQPGQNREDCRRLRFPAGPAWSHDGYLIFSDIPNDKVLKFTPGEGLSELRADSEGANGNAFDVQGRLYTCETHSRRVVRQDRKGRIEVLAERWQGKRLNAPNDLVVRKDGDVYLPDPAFGSQRETRELDFYGVFRISRKGELEVIAKPAGRPKGIALSPNGRILYVTNSDERNVRAYDLDKDGVASNEKVLIAGIEGVPNGIQCDEKGNLYVAARAVQIYTADGQPLGRIEIPETPSNLAFGDVDLQSLYITARTALYRIRLDAKGSPAAPTP